MPRITKDSELDGVSRRAVEKAYSARMEKIRMFGIRQWAVVLLVFAIAAYFSSGLVELGAILALVYTLVKIAELTGHSGGFADGYIFGLRDGRKDPDELATKNFRSLGVDVDRSSDSNYTKPTTK